jgi:RNA polymerase sigma-70 factor (ECF subfamily)
MKSDEQFEAIVNEHYEPLFRFALSLTRAESDARDLTQQTFYVWATKGHQLRDITKVKSWLYTTLHRAFLNGRRREIRFYHHDLDEVPDQLPALTPEFANQVDSSQVLVALAGVDEVYRAAVALFYLEDCPYKDIAAILEVPIGTVKSRISRGLLQLRQILLADDLHASPPHRKDAASNPDASKPVTPPENVICPPGWSAQMMEGVRERGLVEWDLSSILLMERSGALCVV